MSKSEKVKFRIKLKLADFIILAIFLTVTAIFCTFIIINGKTKNGSKTLIITNGNDEWIYQMDKGQSVEIPGNLGKSVIVIEDGKAFFESSPCENKICVLSRKISKSGEWTACLPNGVIIRVEGTDNTSNAERKKNAKRNGANTKNRQAEDYRKDIDAWAE